MQRTKLFFALQYVLLGLPLQVSADTPDMVINNVWMNGVDRGRDCGLRVCPTSYPVPSPSAGCWHSPACPPSRQHLFSVSLFCFRHLPNKKMPFSGIRLSCWASSSPRWWVDGVSHTFFLLLILLPLFILFFSSSSPFGLPLEGRKDRRLSCTAADVLAHHQRKRQPNLLLLLFFCVSIFLLMQRSPKRRKETVIILFLLLFCCPFLFPISSKVLRQLERQFHNRVIDWEELRHLSIQFRWELFQIVLVRSFDFFSYRFFSLYTFSIFSTD